MLDSEIAQFIDAFNALGIDYSQMSAQEARALSHELSGKRPMMKDLPATDIQTATVDLGDRVIGIRIYRPKHCAQKVLPAILYFHGGGFVWGLPEHYDEFCSVLADRAKAAIISVDYRYAPEFPFPAGLNDCYEVLQYVNAHPQKFAVDATHISVAGDSAGANFAAAICLRAREEDHLKIRAQLLIYPCLDVNFETPSSREMGEGYLLTTKTMKWFYQHYLQDKGEENNPLAMPLRAADLSRLPPALIVVAKYDPLYDEGKKYAERLREAKVAVELLSYDTLIHGFIRYGSVCKAARLANEEIVAEFTRLPS
jgi:acetyl esterase